MTLFMDDGFLKMLAAEGMAIVPIEPTDAMLQAADDTAIYTLPEITQLRGYAKQKAKMIIRWRAMLAAAPKPE